MAANGNGDCCCGDAVETKLKKIESNGDTQVQTTPSSPVQYVRNAEEAILHYGALDVICVILSVITYSFDQTMDVVVAVFFYKSKMYGCFILTLTFIIVPALTMTAFSLAWYIHDHKKGHRPPASRLQWTFRAISLFLHFGPILRYIESLVYGCKSRCKRDQKRAFFFMMIYEDTDAGLLRLFESFMEAAPQLVLQIYILASEDVDAPEPIYVSQTVKVGIQVVSVFSSLISLSWALASYNRSLRFSLDNKRNMTWPGTIVQFFWFFFSNASRVLALALFASAYPAIIFVVCFFHWTCMTTWIYLQKTKFCTKEWQEIFFDLVMGVVYIFCFFNVKDEPTRNKYICYYVVVFIEGSALMAFWFTKSNSSQWYRYPAFVGYFCLFAASLIVMAVYYRFYHPSLHCPGHAGVAVDDASVQTDGFSRAALRLHSVHFSGCPRRCGKKIGRITEIDLTPLNEISDKANKNVPVTTEWQNEYT